MADDTPAEKPAAPEQPPNSWSGLTDEFGRPIQDLDPPKEQVGYNAADPKQIAAAKREEGQRRREDGDFWRIAMSTRQRRASLYRLLETCHIYGNAADVGTEYRQSDPHLTYLNLGRESVGKQIMVAAQDASLDLYMTMVKERQEAERARERKDEKKTNG